MKSAEQSVRRRNSRYVRKRDKRSGHRYQILERAVRKGDIDVVRSLIDTFGLLYSKAWLNGYVLLSDALLYRRPEIAKLLLVNGARVNNKTIVRHLETPLHLAVKRGYTEIVSMILEKNGKVDVQDYTKYRRLGNLPLISVENVVEILFGCLIKPRGDDDDDVVRSLTGKSPLHTAVNQGNLKFTELLLNHGARVNGVGWMPDPIKSNCTALHVAVFKRHKALVELLLNRGAKIYAEMSDGRTALHIATALMDVEIVKLLLKRRANVDAQMKNHNTALCIAADVGCESIVEVLLAHKASWNITGEGYAMPIHLAAKINNPTIIAMLLDNGADVNSKEETWNFIENTALHIASQHGHVDVVKLLVERNAHLEVKNQDEETPLHLAAIGGHEVVVETLLRLGANIEAKDYEGCTALDRAARSQFPAAIKVLIDYGADVNVTNATWVTREESGNTPLGSAYFSIAYTASYGYDDVIERRKNVANLLEEHIVAIMALDFFVHEKNLKYIDPLNKHRDLLAERRAEVAEMKSNKIGHSFVSFYDILTANINQLVSFASNNNIVDALESKNLNSAFPTYSKMITRRFRKGQNRKNLLSSGLKSFTSLFGYAPPYLFTTQLFNYLSDKDLANMARAKPSDSD